VEDWISGKRVLGVFSDPAGAKAVLSYLSKNRKLAKRIIIISDREYDFYEDFSFQVKPTASGVLLQFLKGIEVVIAGTSYPTNLELSIIKIANGLGIYTVSIVDHVTNIAARFEGDGGLVYPDVIAVVNNRAYEVAESEGISPSKLRVMENPYHGFLRNWRPNKVKEAFFLELGLSKDAKVILYAPEPMSSFGLKDRYGFDEIDGLKILCKAQDAFPKGSFKIVIKGHANQDHNLFRTTIAGLNDNDLLYLDSVDLNTLSYYSSAVVGFFSNSLLEATILKRPIIRPLMYLKKEVDDPLKSFNKDSFIDTYSIDELIQAIRSIIM
jgi:hypothetical protein